jgi:hypothetical protein
MTKTMIKVSATGRAILTPAATREDRLVRTPNLPMPGRAFKIVGCWAVELGSGLTGRG